MKTILKTWLSLAGFMLLLQGCAGTGGMTKVDAPSPRASDQATIIFMRSSFVGAPISASVFDVTTDETRFVGIVENDTKVAYNVSPGDHVFMVMSESADFMKASVSSGKTYYALVTPRPGVLKWRFSFRPLRQADLAGADFMEWNSGTTLVEKSAVSEAWAQHHAASIEKKRSEYWPEWQAKAQEHRDSQTLNAEDGQ